MNNCLIKSCLLVLMVVPVQAQAWSKVGHQVVAQIAESRLTPATKEAIAKLLDARVTSLPDISMCADQLKRHDTVCGPLHLGAEPASSRWHYIDLPIGEKTDLGSVATHCGSKASCVVQALRAQEEILRDTSRPTAARQLALVMVVHLMGDLHQPLHCATEVDEDGNSDGGANGKMVNFMGLRRQMTLHHLWDNLIEKDSVARNQSPYLLAQALEKSMPADTKIWLVGDEKLWALSTHSMAVDVIYPAFYEDDGAEPGAAYQKRMQPFAHTQLRKAGVRLAFVLNDIFLPEPASTP